MTLQAYICISDISISLDPPILKSVTYCSKMEASGTASIDECKN